MPARLDVLPGERLDRTARNYRGLGGLGDTVANVLELPNFCVLIER